MEGLTQPASKSSTAKAIAVVAVVVVVGAAIGYFLFYKGKVSQPLVPAPAASSPFVPSAAAPAPTSTLGGALYEKASNPIQDKLPAAVAPVPNPIQDAYKNPFQ